jgi:hypothetical protein
MLSVPPATRKLRRELVAPDPQGTTGAGRGEQAGELSGLESGVGSFSGVKIVLQDIDADGRR